MKRAIVTLIAIALGALAAVFVVRPRLPPIPAFINSQAKTPVADPARLVISKIGVNAAIEPVGLDKNGNMGVPTNIYNAGWYALGPKPGQIGQAVIDGHLNTPELQPNIFWNLKKLQPGDIVTILDTSGQQYNFIVQKVVSENTVDFPIQKIFGPASRPQLNLITCDGVWSNQKGTYSQRVVVYTDLGR
ncbi:class F sortase [Patescibacteria group bacterium]|nr:class F sortase [Patescibacteria group bacterium]